MKNSESGNIKDSVSELLQNLGTLGLFMLSETRSFLRKTRGASREEFVAALDQIARKMKQSGKIAAEDVDRAAEKIKASWDILKKEKNPEWDAFLTEVKSKLAHVGEITREVFEAGVNQAKESFDKKRAATGLDDEQSRSFRKESEEMAERLKKEWGQVSEKMRETGKKIDRAIQAALTELKKK